MFKRIFSIILTTGISLSSSLSSAMPVDAEFDVNSVSGSLGGGYTINVPGLGSLSLSYGTPLTSYDGYNAVSTFSGGDNFALGASNSITITANGFSLASAVFEIWDLDTPSPKPTEVATFNGGFTNSVVMTGVSNNIKNEDAHTDPFRVFSPSITPNGGKITLAASPDGAAAFAIGGIKVTAVPLPAAGFMLISALSGLLVAGRRKGRENNLKQRIGPAVA